MAVCVIVTLDVIYIRYGGAIPNDDMVQYGLRLELAN